MLPICVIVNHGDIQESGVPEGISFGAHLLKQVLTSTTAQTSLRRIKPGSPQIQDEKGDKQRCSPRPRKSARGAY